jgi:hypothetical protein
MVNKTETKMEDRRWKTGDAWTGLTEEDWVDIDWNYNRGLE